MSPRQVHPTHRLRAAHSNTYVCTRCQRYTDSRRPEGQGLYDSGLRVPCDHPEPARAGGISNETPAR